MIGKIIFLQAPMQGFILNYAAKEKIDEVKKVLQKAADTNKRKLPELDITPQVWRPINFRIYP